ncbi:MFS transporter [Poseidonocella sp. HB161398]|uniref:MFS transporter n=1 Tax=Poseidonocella sp. HB161398 TaxID=2320855 RepID=UPI001109FA26|nr:MFS transporter [Poseidonocella sp. HB161398]
MTDRTTSAGTGTLILMLCNALFICSISIDLALTGIVGFQLAPAPWLATLPFALITVGTALATWGASAMMARSGRRAGFLAGSAAGLAGGLVSVWAVRQGAFWGFCLGTLLVGIWQAFAQYYRLAAADGVAAAEKPRVISRVLAGGLIAALAGPALANWSRSWLGDPFFSGAYLAVAGLAGLSLLLLLFLPGTPGTPGAAQGAAAVPVRLADLAARPGYRAALANAVAAGVAMMVLMTAAPLAALGCGLGVETGTSIIQWHLLGMYGPSLFTGVLIARLGLGRMLQAGVLVMAAAVAIGLSGASSAAFHAALLALGLGWNFMFVGGSALLAQSHAPEERARAQGFAEFLRYGGTALGALLAGPVLQAAGWAALNLAVLPLLLLASWATLAWQRTEVAPA